MKSVGIDIGSSSIKVVEAQATSNNTYQLNRYIIHNLAPASASDQELEIIEFLRNLSAEYDLSSTRVCLCLRQDKVIIRNKIFPFIERLKINKSLAFEMEEDIPFSAENSIFDSKLAQFRGTNAEVLVCASPKSHVQKLIQLCNDGGIDPWILSVEASAFSGIFEKWMEAPKNLGPLPAAVDGEKPKIERRLRVVLNLGHTHSLICAFEGDVLVGVRYIMWGGQNIIDAIAKKYNLPFKEAQKEMELKAFILISSQEASFESKVFSDLIAKCFREFVRDLQLSLLEFRSELGGEITNVDMTGGLSSVQGLGPFLTQHLEIPVNRIPILDNISHCLFEKTDVTQNRLGVAIGLALEGFKKPRNPAVNFLKGEFARQNHFWKHFRNQWGPSLRYAAIMLVLLYVWASVRLLVSEDLVLASKDTLKIQAKAIAGMKAKEATDSRVKSFIKEAKKNAEDFKTISNLSTMNSGLDILKKLSDQVPSKSILSLDVTHYQLHDSNLVIQGYVKSEQELRNLESSLKNLALDGNLSPLKSSIPASPTKVPFAFSLQVDRNIQKDTL